MASKAYNISSLTRESLLRSPQRNEELARVGLTKQRARERPEVSGCQVKEEKVPQVCIRLAVNFTNDFMREASRETGGQKPVCVEFEG